ncbi:MAG: two-component system sensor histidine kinase NtrB [Planctomycetota bacterium]|jgi:signal transduction histidine kinase
MVTKRDIFVADHLRLPELGRGVLVDQLKWLIFLRWFAIVGVVIAGLVSSTLFPVLYSPIPIYACAGLLFLFNLLFLLLISGRSIKPAGRVTFLAMIQLEIDLLILTLLLYFAGGLTNPFVLFYVFHIIIATIILPRNFSFTIGISAIVMYGLMMIVELNDFPWLRHYPLELSTISPLSRNPVYAMGAFVAFSAMVVLTQYLTRSIIVRMTAKELEAARNRGVLEAVVSTMSGGLIFITNQGKVSISNPSAEKWFPGINQSIEHLPDEMKQHVKSILADESGEALPIKVIKFTLDDPGKSYVEARVYPVIGVDGKRLGIVVIGQDLTQHKRLEQDLLTRTEETESINEMLKLSRVEMAQREKMVAIGQMATGIAHEIGNPLASLSSVAQYLQRKATDSDQTEMLTTMTQHIERISTILKRMLSLSRPATSEYRWADVNTLIENTLSLVQFDRRAKSVQIKNDLNSDLPMVWLNPLHFEQVLLNLFLNALDAMAAQGDQSHQLEITRNLEGSSIVICVKDDGIGMEPAICKRAFDSFFTTKELGKGTGLGLFISYNLVSELDGTIELDSELGKGTTVTIKIPVRPKNDLLSGDNADEGLAKEL